MRRENVVAGIIAILVVIVCASSHAAEQDVAAFYKGKTVECIVPYRTGGGYDAWIRLMSPFLGRITGATVVIKNMPGAGGLVGTDRLYVSDPNGLTIGMLNGPGVLQAQVTGATGVKYDCLKFTWLGRPTTEQQVLAVGKKSPYRSIEAMQKASKPVKFGAPGIGSSMYAYSALTAEVLGIKADIICGYETSEEVDLAIIRGEMDAAWGSFSSKIDMMKQGDMSFVLQSGNVKMAELQKVPHMANLPGLNEEKKHLADFMVALGESGRPMAAPPGVPPERSRFLADAIKKTLDDPSFREIAKKQEMEVIYMGPDELAKTIEKGIKLPPNVKQRFVDVMAKYQPKK